MIHPAKFFIGKITSSMKTKSQTVFIKIKTKIKGVKLSKKQKLLLLGFICGLCGLGYCILTNTTFLKAAYAASDSGSTPPGGNPLGGGEGNPLSSEKNKIPLTVYFWAGVLLAFWATCLIPGTLKTDLRFVVDRIIYRMKYGEIKLEKALFEMIFGKDHGKKKLPASFFERIFGTKKLNDTFFEMIFGKRDD